MFIAFLFIKIRKIQNTLNSNNKKWKGFVSFQKKNVLLLQTKKTGSFVGCILIRYIPIMGGCMVDGYEMGIYE